MPVNAGQIVIQINAGTAEFVQSLERAKGNLREFGSSAKHEANEAKGAMAILSDEIGIRLPRHIRNFIAEMPGISTALNSAFNAVAIIGIGLAIVETTKKVVEFFSKTSEGKEKSQKAFDTFRNSLALSGAELDVSNDKLERTLAKLTGKPVNNLALALDQDRLFADKLTISIGKANEELEALLKTQATGMLASVLNFASGKASPNSAIADVRGKLDYNLEQSRETTNSVNEPGITADEAESRQTEGNASQNATFTAEIKDYNDKIDALKKQQAGSTGQWARDQTEAIRVYQEALVATIAEQHRLNATIKEKDLTGKIDKEQSKKDANEAALKAKKEATEKLKKADEDGLEADQQTHKAGISELISYWQSRLEAEKDNGERSEEITKTLSELGQRNLQAWNKVVEKGAALIKQQADKARQELKTWSDIVEEGLSLSDKLKQEGIDKDSKSKDLSATGKADQAQAATNAAKLAAERAYSLELFHTASQQIAYMAEMAGFEQQSRAATEAKLQTELDVAKVKGDQLEIQKAQNALDKQRLDDANATYAAETAIKQAQAEQNQMYVAGQKAKQTLGQWNTNRPGTIVSDIASKLEQLPQQLGDTIANAVFSHKKGDSAGKQFGELFRNLGKQLFGEVIGQLIEKLAAEIAVHLFGISIQTTATTATTVNTTTGLIPNTIAVGTNTTTGLIPNTLALALNTAAIVKLTTAMSQGGGSGSGSGSGGGMGGDMGGGGDISGGGDLGGGASDGGSSLSGAFGGLSSMLGNLTSELGSFASSIGSFISSAFTGLVGLLGFADGTDSAPGGMAWVGEHGKELVNLPRGAQVIPNHLVAAYLRSGAPGVPQAFSVSRTDTLQAHLVQASGSSQSFTSGNHTFHIHGVTDPAMIAKKVAGYLKDSSPKFSNYSH